MNREIKFRGIRIDNGEIVVGSLILKYGKSYICYKASVKKTIGRKDIWCETEVAPESVGQFTGLHDKNGVVEAYEKDLAKHPSSKHLFEIVFYKGAFWLQSQEPSLLKNNIKTNISHLEFCEIIGNSFTNPELINK